MNIYESPELTVIKLDDVITTSDQLPGITLPEHEFKKY